ncbi:30S ribosomal protein S4e [archaeon SCG-AAA382B04]|nr:30S ribosomal protein S4e [archaeon SCG-AAA382B04]
MPMKKYSIPKSWKIEKRDETWVTSPNSPHSKEKSIPLNVLLRDIIGLVDKTREVKRILENGDLEVDGRKIRDHRFGVGLLDVISIPKADFYIRVSLDKKDRLKFIEIDQEEANKKICKIEDKRSVSGGDFQLNLHDGKNIKLEEAEQYSPQDSLLIELPSQEIQKTLEFEEGNQALITGGKHSGKVAEIKQRKIIKGSTPNEVMLDKDGEQFSTIQKYVTVIGENNPEVTTHE